MLILKACVANNFALRIVETIEYWLAKRKIINDSGITTPKLFAIRDGVLLEEFIPYSLTPQFIADSPNSMMLLSRIALTSGRLQKLAFAPIALFEDLRSRGDDVVIVDFGQDLGFPNTRLAREEPLLLYNQMLKFLSESGIPLFRDLSSYMSYGYIQALHSET
jgi:hypothetical protein